MENWVWAVAVIVGFYIAGKLAYGAVNHIGDNDPDRADLFALLAKVTQIGLMIFGLVTALGTLGVDVSALVAGLGLTGFALGFALKDAISNLISGGMIIAYQPFKRGQVITVDGKTGEVESIDLRYTELRGDGVQYLVPNSKILSSVVTVTPKEKKKASPSKNKTATKK